MPSLQAYCHSKGWDVPHLPLQPISPMPRTARHGSHHSAHHNPFHRLHRKMMKRMHRHKHHPKENEDHARDPLEDASLATDSTSSVSDVPLPSSLHHTLQRSIQSDVLRRMFLERQQRRRAPPSPSSSSPSATPARLCAAAPAVLGPLAALLGSSCISSPAGPAAALVRQADGQGGAHLLLFLGGFLHVLVVHIIARCSARVWMGMRGPAAAVSLAHTVRFMVALVTRMSVAFATLVCGVSVAYAWLAHVSAPKEEPWMELALTMAQAFMTNAASFFAFTMISAQVMLFYPRRPDVMEAAAMAVGIQVKHGHSLHRISTPLSTSLSSVSWPEEPYYPEDENSAVAGEVPKRTKSTPPKVSASGEEATKGTLRRRRKPPLRKRSNST
uniref:Uncharacterized protein n=1 Tax=Corethron hystrix TaxID=216773 RepID=A0A7S1BW91_9STRA